MLRKLAVATALLLPLMAMSISVAADPPVAPNVPETATLEIIRRGHSVEELGTTQAGPEAEKNKLNAPPDDDSDRPFVTLVVTDDPQYAEACDRIRQDINAGNLKGYILPDNAAESWSHYSVRLYPSKPTAKPPLSNSWFAKVGPLLNGQPFPALVIQPPRNGEHGDNKAIMGIVHGYGNGPDGFAGEPEYTNERIRIAVDEYSKSRYANGLTYVNPESARGEISGHAQKSRQPIPPPFEVEKEQVDLTQPRRLWPTHLDKPPTPPEPVKYTYTQVRKLAPEAPTKWVRELVKAGVTTDDEVSEAYDEWKDEQKEAKAAKESAREKEVKHVAPVAPAVHPAQPAPPAASPAPPAADAVVTQEPSSEVDQTPANFLSQGEWTTTEPPPSSEHAEAITSPTSENPITISLTLIAIVIGLALLWKGRGKSPPSYQLRVSEPKSNANMFSANATNSPSRGNAASSTKNTPDPLGSSLGVYSEDPAG